MQEVRRLREEKGWGQKELAFHAHLAQSVISEIETGKRSPSARTLQKLAGALGVEVRELFPLGQAPLFREPPERELPSDERRAAWEDAVEQARHLRETGRARMWKALSEWRASKGRGEPYAARRKYLDEIGDLLQKVYEAGDALGWAYIQAASSPTWTAGSDANVPSYLREESREMDHFYGKLFELVTSSGLNVRTGDDAAAAKQAAAEEAAAEHAQSETRPHRVEEDDAA
jgi:transcriptional regulator with XRE-family HTH domain